MWPNPQFSADFVTFTEEILNGKLHFLCSVMIKALYIQVLKSFPIIVNSTNFRSNRPEVFSKKGVLKNFAKSQENTCARVSFLIKLLFQGCNLIKKDALTQMFSCEFCKIVKPWKLLNIAKPFFTEHLWATVFVSCKFWLLEKN